MKKMVEWVSPARRQSRPELRPTKTIPKAKPKPSQSQAKAKPKPSQNQAKTKPKPSQNYLFYQIFFEYFSPSNELAVKKSDEPPKHDPKLGNQFWSNEYPLVD
jgi:hypothetical protein